MKATVRRTAIALPLTLLALTGLCASARATDPILTAWYMKNSGLRARVLETSDPGRAEVLIWPSSDVAAKSRMDIDPATGLQMAQTKPAYTDVQEVSYKTVIDAAGVTHKYVYVRTAGLASHGMGPWYNEIGGIVDILGTFPLNKHVIHRFPRYPMIPAAKTVSDLSAVGLWVNGVSMFNMWSGLYWDPVAGKDVHGDPKTAMWTCSAPATESITFDGPGGHQPSVGEYHFHQNPVALRYQVGDCITRDASGEYHEAPSVQNHSKILGYANDGIPVYGPYGYSSPTSAASGVRRMRTGYALRAIARRHTLPAWAAALHGIGTGLPMAQWGPDVSSDYPLGHYTEDYDYLGDLGYTYGVDFDLNQYNARWCVTPEYPKGTWAYFVTIDDAGTPVYPFVIGRQYMGDPSEAMRVTNSTAYSTIGTAYAKGGSKSTPKIMFTLSGPGYKTIYWSSVEGGYYKILGSPDGVTWYTVATKIKSTGLYTYLTMWSPTAAYGYAQYKVSVTSFDPFDSVFP